MNIYQWQSPADPDLRLSDDEIELLNKVLDFKLVLDSKHKICFKEIANKVELEISKELKTRQEKFDVDGHDRNSYDSMLETLYYQRNELIKGKREEEYDIEPLKTELEKLSRRIRQVSNVIDLIDKQGELETLLLGEFVPSKVILYVKNIADACHERELLLISTFIHEMFHAWNYHTSKDHNEVVREIEEPMVEFGTLMFLHEISETKKEFQPILELAKENIQNKQCSIGRLAAYGFGYYLYSLLSTDTGIQAKSMLEKYGEISGTIGESTRVSALSRYSRMEATDQGVDFHDPPKEYLFKQVNEIVKELKNLYPFDREKEVFDLFYAIIIGVAPGQVLRPLGKINILKKDGTFVFDEDVDEIIKL